MRRTGGVAQSEWQGGKMLELEKKIRAGIDRNPVLGCDAEIIAIIHRTEPVHGDFTEAKHHKHIRKLY